jgi:hypothetical protein
VSAIPLSPRRTLVAGALAVGVLDILKPILFTTLMGGSATRVLQSVASGALGREAYQGGLPTALLGLGFHFFIAFCVFATYYAASRRLRSLATHALVLGPLYGIAVYLFMQFVVFPLSAIGPVKHPPAVLFDGILTHILCVGLPTGLVIHEAGRRRPTLESTL